MRIIPFGFITTKIYSQDTDEKITKAQAEFDRALTNAQTGNPAAQYRVARYLFEGYGTPKDISQCVVWLEKAGEAHYPPAMNTLGKVLRDVLQIPEYAMPWFEAAADLGHLDAQYHYGLYCVGEKKPPHQIIEGLTYLCRAADQGHDRARVAFFCSIHKNIADETPGVLDWLMRNAMGESAVCRTFLGKMYSSGIGVKQDMQKGVYYYEQAVKMGEPRAKTELGQKLMSGQTVDKNEWRGFQLLKESANAGYRNAMNPLAVCYFFGRGTPANEVLALAWNELGVEQEQTAATAYKELFLGNLGYSETQEARQEMEKLKKKMPWGRWDPLFE